MSNNKINLSGVWYFDKFADTDAMLKHLQTHMQSRARLRSTFTKCLDEFYL